MIKKFLLLYLMCTVTFASEADVVKRECKGAIEFKLADGTRVDCLTKDEAQEFDFNYNWHECLTQALHYGMWTKRKSVCVLIAKTSTTPLHVKRFNDVKNHYMLPVELRVINYE